MMKFTESIRLLHEYTVFNISIFKILAAVIVILLVFAVRGLVIKVIIRLTSKFTVHIDKQLLSAIEPTIRFALLIFSIWIAVKILVLPLNIKQSVNHIIHSMITFSIFWGLYRTTGFLSSIIQSLFHKTGTGIDDIFMSLITKSLKIIVVIMGTTVIAQDWGFNFTGFVAGLGLGGLAFALAARDTAANLFGSITLMVDRPFNIGDWIYTPHVEGTVEEIGLRSTKVRTFAQALVTVPNSVMSNDTITNWSKMGKRRVTFKIGIDFNILPENIERCMTALRNMLQDHPGVHPDIVFVYLENITDSALEILFYFSTKTTEWKVFLEVQEDIHFKIIGILNDMNIRISK